MKSYPRDWIAWSLAAAIVIVFAVSVISGASASQPAPPAAAVVEQTKAQAVRAKS